MPVLTDVDETGDLIAGSKDSTLETLHLESTDADDLWVHLYDAATAGEVTEGTDTPKLSFHLPAGTEQTWSPFERFSAGIVIAAMQEFSGAATGPGANEVNGSCVVR